MTTCTCGQIYDPRDGHDCPRRQPWRQNIGKSANSRGYGATWRRIRAQQLRQFPLCAECGAEATNVDHIIPKARNGSDHPHNLRSLCEQHKKAKDNKDARSPREPNP